MVGVKSWDDDIGESFRQKRSTELLIQQSLQWSGTIYRTEN